MSKEQEIQRLAEYFRALGAYCPEDWARSQVQEGKPQYGRFVFLRQAWQTVVGDGDTSWIDPQIQQSGRGPRGPGASIGPALKRLLAAGASREDLTEVVRVMQWQVLAGIMYQLDDPSTVEYPSDEIPHVNWALFEVDEDSRPRQPLGGLHESVLNTEPSGREMRPKGVSRAG
jgi:hypothetical protein